jgi:acyl carrier protein
VVEIRQSDSPRRDLLAGVIAMIAQATREDEAWASAVTTYCRLEGDLWLDSVELAALAGLLQSAYGDEVDLTTFLTSLEIDELIGLTVGDLVGYIAGCLDPEGSSMAQSRR